MALIIATILLGTLVLHISGSSFEKRPDIKNLLVDITFGLTFSGFIIPLVLAFTVGIKPSSIEEITPYAGYILIILLVWLLATNFRRFKLINTRKLLLSELISKPTKPDSKIEPLDKKIHKYRSDMILIVILIAYTSLLFSWSQ